MADTIDRAASGQESVRLISEFVKALEREAGALALGEGMPEESGIAQALLATGTVLVKQATRLADTLPNVAPDHPRFEMELAVRRALKEQVREMCEQIIAESQA